jgi:hypothetical protein
MGAGGEHRRRVYAALAVDLRIPQHGKELGDGGKKAGVVVCKMPTAAKGSMVRASLRVFLNFTL